MNWFRRLFTNETREPENRGTLTLLPDGTFLLGLPHGTNDDVAYHAAKSLPDWLESPDRKLLILPFPVDVIDQRGTRPSLAIGGLYGLQRPLERIVKALEHIDRKTTRRRARIIECQHPELHANG
jgi:hypothetical protein